MPHEPHEIEINAQTGAVRIGGLDIALEAGLPRDAAAAALASYLHANRDHGNGYEWLNFRGLLFGGKRAAMSVCFKAGHLQELNWNVELRSDPSDTSWPTPAENEQETAFMRKTLSAALKRSFSSGEERFAWGVAWSLYDKRGDTTSSGIRYTG
jgi:hypothetical protein